MSASPEHDETFFAVEQRPHPTAAGACPLPVLYRDTAVLGLCFFGEIDRARRQLEGLDIEPWPIAGHALVLVVALDHRDTSIGAHRELAVAMACRRVGKRPSLLRFAIDMRAQEEQGTWIAWGGATTELASAAGAELWGYPRTVTPIEARFEPARTTIETDDLEIVAPTPTGPLVRPLPLITCSDRRGRLIRTIAELEGGVRVGSGRRTSLELRGRGPSAELLRDLGLDGKRPTAVFHGEGVRARLPLGADLGPIIAAPP